MCKIHLSVRVVEGKSRKEKDGDEENSMYAWVELVGSGGCSLKRVVKKASFSLLITTP